MTYVNTTGKNIGECLTGFAISYPLNIYNSGKSEVQYTFDNSNETNFALSQSSLLLDSSDYGNIDIYYVPSVTSPAGTQSTTITITSAVSGLNYVYISNLAPNYDSSYRI